MKQVLSLLAICLIHFAIRAQTSVNGAGGEATGSNGQMSFSVGEIVYTTMSNASYSVAQGIQQPYIPLFNYTVSATNNTICSGTAVTLSVNLPGSFPSGTVFTNGIPTSVVDVVNPVTGKIWMDRNLGASQVATSSTDASAFGDLYQWGRQSDGHQNRNSDTISILSASNNPGHDKFILSSFDPTYDWLITQNNDLWQGVNGINNPCPIGYRIPTMNELDIERASWSSQNSNGAFNSPLKFPTAGFREMNGDLLNVFGWYWSSTISAQNATFLHFRESQATVIIEGERRTKGYSVRCIKHN